MPFDTAHLAFNYAGKFIVEDGSLSINIDTGRFDRINTGCQEFERAMTAIQAALNKVGLDSEIEGSAAEKTGAEIDTFPTLKATFEISAENVQKINQATEELLIDFIAASVQREVQDLVTYYAFGIAPQNRFGVTCRAASAITTALTAQARPT